MGQRRNQTTATVVTLGPSGIRHERAMCAYTEFQGVEDFEVEFIEDFFEGLELIRGRREAFLIQCSAHPLVHWGSPGPGRWISIYANAEHVFMVIAGLRFDTRSDPEGVNGPRWKMAAAEPNILPEFAVRHPVGL